MKIHTDAVIVAAPVDRVFEYYIRLENLARMTPPDVRMRVISAQTPLRRGSRIRFGLRHRSIPFEVRWESVISEFEVNRVFCDRQVRGPFEHWIHRHEFRGMDDGRTEVVDTIECGAPLGILGRVAEALFLDGQIEHLFEYRRKVLRRDLEVAPDRPVAMPSSTSSSTSSSAPVDRAEGETRSHEDTKR